MQRHKTDYVWLAGFFVLAYGLGQLLQPGRSEPSDLAALRGYMDVLGVENPVLVQVVFFGITAVGMSGMTLMLWLVIRAVQPDLPLQNVRAQLKTIAPNLLFVLPLYQSVLNYCMTELAITKVTLSRTAPLQVILDMALWMFVFELMWYTQHRAMHDNYYLWKYGHEYHHGWRRKVCSFGAIVWVEIWE